MAQVIYVGGRSGEEFTDAYFSRAIPGDNVVENNSCKASERLGSLYTLRGKERSAEYVTGDSCRKAQSHTDWDTLTAPNSSLTLPAVVYPDPMMSFAITPASKSDADKIKVAIDRLMEEDPTLTTSVDSLSGKMVLNGMGQAHLDMAIERMSRKYKVNVTHELPPVPYRETLRNPVQHVEGKHKKQTGGAGQFGVALMNVSPQSREAGFEFVDGIKGGSIPNQFIPSVEKRIKSRMKSGFLAGYPIVDIKVELVDGKYHPVDSKDVVPIPVQRTESSLCTRGNRSS